MPQFRVVLVADTHLGFDLPLHPRVERRRRGDDFAANFERVLAFVRETRPAVLVHGGDVFFRSRVPPGIATPPLRALHEVADSGVHVVIAPGNHDASRLPPSLWLGHPNIHVFDAPRTFRVGAGGVSAAIGGFPFARGDVRSALPALIDRSGVQRTEADLRLLCFHQTVEGATVGPSGFTFRRGLDVIPHRALPASLTAVLAGHIHRAQVLEGPGPPVYYPGSTERTSFAERFEPKGFFELTLAPSVARRWEVVEARFHELPSRPMVDVPLPPGADFEAATAALAKAAARLPEDAVVRVMAGPDVAPEVMEHLTAEILRAAFPPSMNVQPSWGRAYACE